MTNAQDTQQADAPAVEDAPIAARDRNRRIPKIALKFRKPYGLYNAGEIAGFDEIRALELMNAEVAEPLDGNWRGVLTPAQQEAKRVQQVNAAREIRRRAGTPREASDAMREAEDEAIEERRAREEAETRLPGSPDPDETSDKPGDSALEVTNFLKDHPELTIEELDQIRADEIARKGGARVTVINTLERMRAEAATGAPPLREPGA